MPESSIGRSERLVRPSVGVERAGSATDHSHRDRRHEREHPPQDHEPSERRDPKPPNPLRRRLYDLLFEEIDDIDALSPNQKTRIKDNIRANLTTPPAPPPPAPRPAPPYAHSPRGPRLLPRAESPTVIPTTDEEDESLARDLLADPRLEVDHDGIVGLAVPEAPHQSADEALENARLARQVRECLALHTERARKVGVYLHLLLSLHPDPRPHVVVMDV